MKTILEILRLALEALKLVKPPKKPAKKIQPGKGPFDADSI